MQRQAPAILHLARTSVAIQKSVLSSMKKDLLLALVDCAKTILQGHTELTEEQYKALKRKSEDIRLLTKASTTLTQKKNILQKGGFLGMLLKPLIGPLLGGLFGGDSRRRRD